MRRWAALVLLGLFATACGGTTATTTTSSEAPATTRATTTISPPTTLATTTTTAPATTSSLSPDASPVLDRSVLALALEPGDTSPGRFKLVRGPNSETLMTVEGRYWVRDEGNVYTALDVDTELIAEQMVRLVGLGEAAGGQPIDSPYLNSLRQHYRGNEFHIGLIGTHGVCDFVALRRRGPGEPAR